MKSTEEIKTFLIENCGICRHRIDDDVIAGVARYINEVVIEIALEKDKDGKYLNLGVLQWLENRNPRIPLLDRFSADRPNSICRIINLGVIQDTPDLKCARCTANGVGVQFVIPMNGKRVLCKFCFELENS